MKRLLTLVAFFATVQASAQQVNPVPDYVFRNQMSVGRGTVTDTAAYFSIGPRYGANKGFMPPIVGDTATFSSGKRNGLLIFSVQKNKFLYWDSVRVQWSDMAGSSGSYIVAGDTASMLTPYVRQAGYGLTKSGQSFLVDTLNIATRAWRQKGLDSLAALEVSGSGTTNYIPKFTAGSTIGNSQIFDNGTNVGLGTASPGAKFHLLSATGTAQTQGDFANNLAIMQGASRTGTTAVGGSFATTLSLQSNDDVITAGSGASIGFAAKWNTGLYSSAAQFGSIFGGKENSTDANLAGYLSFATRPAGGNPTERLRITSGGNVGIGTTAPNGKLDVSNAGDVAIWATATSAGSAALYLYPSGVGVAQIASVGAVPLQFLTNGSERARITSIGEFTVGFGTANTVGFTTGAAMRATNTTNTSSFEVGLLGGSGSADAFVYQRHSAAMIFATANLERYRLTAGGNMLIGTTADAGYKVEINGQLRSVYDQNGDAFMIIRNPNAGASSQAVFRAENGTYFGHYGIRGTSASTFGALLANDTYIYTNNDAVNTGITLMSAGANGVIKFATGGSAEKMRITAAGNVGIGTTSPLAVTNYTGLTLAGTNGSFTSLYTGASQIARIEVNTTSDFTIKSIANVPLLFGTNNTENARFNTGGELLINTTTDAGDYKLQVAGNIYGSGLAVIGNAIINTNSPFVTGANIYTNGQSLALGTQGANLMSFFTNNAERGRINSAGEWIIDASGTDAGDYKLQVVGNARIGTGKLDIVTNTAFGLSLSRSGTDVVAQQINNSTGILYYGAESSTGGALFTGSSAYAAVIGSGANYPLQFASNNITRATLNTSGELQIGSTSDVGDYKLQVIGNGYFGGSITTNAPDGGNAKPWKLGSVIATTVILDTANYVEVEINGVAYKLALVIPN